MPESNPPKVYKNHFLDGGGEMGKLIRSYNWSQTDLGTPDSWPQNLLNTIEIILNSRFPMFLWWGPELIQFYNDAYRPSLGNEGKHPKAVGQKGFECWPEIWPVIKPIIDQVLLTGESSWSEDQLIPIYRNNKLEDVYWTFSYSRIKDEFGDPAGILVICNETTEKVNIHNDLIKAKKELEAAQAETQIQRDDLNRLFMQAPAGICILNGPEFIFELINPLYQQLFPGRELLGKPILEAMPELAGQSIMQVLEESYLKDKPFEGNGLNIPLIRNEGGLIEDRYFNFIYQPRHNTLGNVDGLLVFAYEVTEIIKVTKNLEKAEDTLKLTIQAAELGTFDRDYQSGFIYWDERCRNLFGTSHQNAIDYEKDFINTLHPEDRDRIVDIIQRSLNKSVSNGDYHAEYRVIGARDQKLRWIRAMGKVYFDKLDKPLRFIGSVLNITEQKLDELRKNDFIGMVSHELKTPLTSLNAYVQILQSKAKSSNDPFSIAALGKVKHQVNKMSTLINGFLNITLLESGKLHLNKQNFNINQLIRDVIVDTQLIYPNYSITLLQGDEFIIHADSDKIESVLSNLLSNAAKYSQQFTKIELACRIIDNNLQVSVKDEGTGIKPQDIKKLFDRYYRVEDSPYISGFGIGLYLSAEIIQRHGGKMWVQSEIDKGSVFYFEIPAN